MRRALCAALAGLLAGPAACGREGSPPGKGPAADKLPHYRVAEGFRLPASPAWTRARKRGHLVVGAKEDQPYLGERDPATGTYSGFDIEIARMMSASLGFPPKTIRFRTIASANRETALQNGRIDYYVGTDTINAGRKKLVRFAGPYCLAGHHHRRHPDRLRGEGAGRTPGRRQAVLQGALRHRRPAHRRRPALRARRRTRGPREERRLEEGVRRHARPVRRARTPPARHRPLSGEPTEDGVNVLTDNFSIYGDGFLGTLELTVCASLLAPRGSP